MTKWLLASWYQPHPIRWLLWPLSALYSNVVWWRKKLYQLAICKQTKLPVPVIIIGNISVGGTGKTPCVIWLAQYLTQSGYRPGIISRGYGGKHDSPQLVTPQSHPEVVGDEPVMISRHSQCPMAVFAKRVEAAQLLLQHYDCNIIIADDGLQHTALARDIEIVIVDGQRLFGNGLCLPAGPLREPLSRLSTVDFIVYNGGQTQQQFMMTLLQGAAINLVDHSLTKPLCHFSNTPVHAVAGIGNPDRFFKQLAASGLTIQPHPFIDHHHFQKNDFDFAGDATILMTEKDAVKCQAFATKNMWYIPINAVISGKLEQAILHKLEEISTYG